MSRVEAMERWHFWFRGRGILVRALIGREKIERNALHLELGCGTGRIVGEMMDRGHRVVGVDLRPEGLTSTRHSRPSAMLVQADAVHLPFRPGSFDLVTALDVIEHVDDSAALSEVRRVLRPTGKAILSVPALPWLWSARDVEAGHNRRYTRRDLRAALLRARLSVVAMRYYQFLLFPVLVASRVLGRLNTMQSQRREEMRIPLLNGVFGWINGIEAQVAARVSLPWGSSLVAVCKPA